MELAHSIECAIVFKGTEKKGILSKAILMMIIYLIDKLTSFL